MHNIDRTVGGSSYEYNNEMNELNPESYEYQAEYSNENEDEFLNELNGVSGEMNEYAGEISGEANELSNEAMEMELATELLEVSNEAELEQFLGSLIKRAAGAVKTFANSSAGQAIGGFLKSAAKKALPIVGRAAGAFLGGPAGSAIGGQLGSMASNLFELELEGLSNEDKEFEFSRAYVRFANAAVRQAMRNPRFRTAPVSVAKNAIINAAKRYAPGLLRPARSYRQGYRTPYGRSSATAYANSNYAVNNNYNQQGYDDDTQQSNSDSGTWYKQGNRIILNL